MKSRREDDHEGLTLWLRNASEGLASAARDRIGLEIEAHYLDSVAAHLEDGLLLSEAKAAAVMELGDPVEAGKRFRKQHLTEKEADTVRQMLKWSLGWHGVVVNALIVLAAGLNVTTCGYSLPSSDSIWGLTISGMTLGVALVGFFVARMKPSSNLIRFLAVFGAIIEIFGWAVCVGLAAHWGAWWFGALIACRSWMQGFPALRFWIKLRRVADLTLESRRVEWTV